MYVYMHVNTSKIHVIIITHNRLVIPRGGITEKLNTSESLRKVFTPRTAAHPQIGSLHPPTLKCSEHLLFSLLRKTGWGTDYAHTRQVMSTGKASITISPWPRKRRPYVCWAMRIIYGRARWLFLTVASQE